jgi:hypothetical protein
MGALIRGSEEGRKSKLSGYGVTVVAMHFAKSLCK